MDQLCELVQHPADVIGEQAECDPAYITNFGEEVVRGHSMFAVSRMLSESRRAGSTSVRGARRGTSPRSARPSSPPTPAWSPSPSSRTSKAWTTPPPRSSSSPPNSAGWKTSPALAAVLTAAPVDLLSHIAIRARQTGVLLAAMPDPAGWEALVARAGQGVKIEVVGEEVKVSESELGARARVFFFFFFRSRLFFFRRAQAHARPQGGHRGLARDSG